MRRAIPVLAAAIAFSLIAEAAIAAVSGGLSVEISRSRRVVLPGAASTVSVADPAIADVAVLDSHSIIIIGKSYGVTDIVVTDHTGRLLLDGRVSVVPLEIQRTTVIHGGQPPTDYVCAGRCAVSAGPGAAPASEAQAASPTTVRVGP